MKWIMLITMVLLPLQAVTDQREYKRYQANFENCKRQIETLLLESPEFSGDIWTARSRADIACRNRLGGAPARFSSYEEGFATRVDLISPQSWDFESLIEGASGLAEKHQSSFLGLDDSYGLLDQVNAIFEWLVSGNMVCYSSGIGSITEIGDKIKESKTKAYKECESEIRKAAADYVRSFNEYSD